MGRVKIYQLDNKRTPHPRRAIRLKTMEVLMPRSETKKLQKAVRLCHSSPLFRADVLRRLKEGDK